MLTIAQTSLPMMMMFVTRGGEGPEGETEDRKATRSRSLERSGLSCPNRPVKLPLAIAPLPRCRKLVPHRMHPLLKFPPPGVDMCSQGSSQPVAQSPQSPPCSRPPPFARSLLRCISLLKSRRKVWHVVLRARLQILLRRRAGLCRMSPRALASSKQMEDDGKSSSDE